MLPPFAFACNSPNQTSLGSFGPCLTCFGSKGKSSAWAKVKTSCWAKAQLAKVKTMKWNCETNFSLCWPFCIFILNEKKNQKWQRNNQASTATVALPQKKGQQGQQFVLLFKTTNKNAQERGKGRFLFLIKTTKHNAQARVLNLIIITKQNKTKQNKTKKKQNKTKQIRIQT